MQEITSVSRYHVLKLGGNYQNRCESWLNTNLRPPVSWLIDSFLNYLANSMMKQPWPNWILSQNLPGRTEEKSWKTSVSIVGVLVVIWPRCFLNVSLECYHYASLFGGLRFEFGTSQKWRRYATYLMQTFNATMLSWITTQ